MRHDIIAESFETSVPWDRCARLCRNVKQRVSLVSMEKSERERKKRMRERERKKSVIGRKRCKEGREKLELNGPDFRENGPYSILSLRMRTCRDLPFMFFVSDKMDPKCPYFEDAGSS